MTQRRQTSIAVAWQSPPLPQQNGIITNYTVHITPPEGDSYTLVTVGLSLTVYNLLSNSLYAFAVAASTVAGRGPYTNPSLPVRTSSPGIIHEEDLSNTCLLLFHCYRYNCSTSRCKS